MQIRDDSISDGVVAVGMRKKMSGNKMYFRGEIGRIWVRGRGA